MKNLFLIVETIKYFCFQNLAVKPNYRLFCLSLSQIHFLSKNNIRCNLSNRKIVAIVHYLQTLWFTRLFRLLRHQVR